MLVLNDLSLEVLAEQIVLHAGSLPKACRALGFNLRNVHSWMVREPEVAAAIRAAQETGWSTIEDEIYRRAIDGYEKPVYQKGELAGYETVYSDSLLSLMAKARLPDYKARPEEGGRGTTVNVAIMPRADNYEDWVVQRDRHLEGIHGTTRQLTPPSGADQIDDAEYTEVPAPTGGLRDIL